MRSDSYSKTFGAFVVGFVLIGAAYVLANFQENKPLPPEQSAAVLQTQTSPRVAIEVTDLDENGIEDWRDDFITTEPIVLGDVGGVPYEPPDTLTGELGLNFFQDIVRARTQGSFGRDDDEIIKDTVEVLRRETATDSYDTPDITILQTWGNEDIRNYANATALAVINNDVNDVEENELFILQDLLNRNDQERLRELESLATMYANTRDAMLKVPVPASLAKQHLDLINTFHAMHADVSGMTKSYSDPAYALLRLKRYEDDVTGMYVAFQNIYRGLEPYASLFTVDDPAALFVLFGPNIQL